MNNINSRITHFIADTHFGHIGLLEKRPQFASIREHDDFIVRAWNAVVGPHDDVWHLGDFAMHLDAPQEARLFRRLQGRKHLVVGNHDAGRLNKLPWSSPPSQGKTINCEGRTIVLSHFPLRAWPGVFRGAINLYGHTHGLLPDTRQSCDVGVDRWGFRPVRLAECVERMKESTIIPEELRYASAVLADA